MQLATEPGDRQSIAWCNHELGHLERFEGNLTAALSHFTEALAINQALGNSAGITAAEINLAVVLRADGDIEGAEAYFETYCVFILNHRTVEGKHPPCTSLARLSEIKATTDRPRDDY